MAWSARPCAAVTTARAASVLATAHKAACARGKESAHTTASASGPSSAKAHGPVRAWLRSVRGTTPRHTPPPTNVKAHAYQHGVGPQNHLRGYVGGARHYRPDRRHRAVWLQHTMRDQVHAAVWQHPLRLPCSNATAPHRFDTGGIECAQRQFYVAGIQRCNSHILFRSVTPSGQQMPAPAVATRLGAKADRWTPGTRPSWAAPASHTIDP